MKDRLPLEIDTLPNHNHKVFILDNKEETVCMVSSFKNKKESAEFIIKACNNYYPLIEALEELYKISIRYIDFSRLAEVEYEHVRKEIEKIEEMFGNLGDEDE